jgi:hypothetical protein
MLRAFSKECTCQEDFQNNVYKCYLYSIQNDKDCDGHEEGKREREKKNMARRKT